MTNQILLPFEGETTKVVKTCNRALIHNFTTSKSQPLSLARRALEGLEKTFKKYDHNPDERMWNALTGLALAMEGAVEGNLSKDVHVTSLDPGLGKTQSVIHFIDCLLSSSYRDVGVLICVSRINEVQSYINELNLPRELFCVVTSDKELNAEGSKPMSAPIMITTQQMIENRCSDGSFEKVAIFHYQNKPRRLRIWDEAILPGKTITLGRFDIFGLLKPVSTRYPDLSHKLEELSIQIKDMNNGHQFCMPDFAGDFNVDINEIHSLLEDNDNLRRTATSLWFLSGRLVTIKNDGKKSNTVIDFQETLPDDLLPLIVLDASARVRGTYALWRRDRGGIKILPSATKCYDDLNVHIWQTGGGKSAFMSDGHKLADGIASTINAKPNEEWLVVHHQNKHRINVEDDVRDMLKVRQNNVHFITWGNHHATNDYKDIPNVILAGTLFYPNSHYEALGRLSAKKSAWTGSFPKEDEMEITHGEHAHVILQALCRGAVRKCVNGKCAPCDAYIIASTRSGIPEAIPKIFPGCKLKQWKPLQTALKGKVKHTVMYLIGRIIENPDVLVKFKEVREVIGISSCSNFRNNIRHHPDFQEAIAEAGIMENLTTKRPTGFVKITGLQYGFTEQEAA